MQRVTTAVALEQRRWSSLRDTKLLRACLEHDCLEQLSLVRRVEGLRSQQGSAGRPRLQFTTEQALAPSQRKSPRLVTIIRRLPVLPSFKTTLIYPCPFQLWTLDRSHLADTHVVKLLPSRARICNLTKRPNCIVMRSARTGRAP